MPGTAPTSTPSRAGGMLLALAACWVLTLAASTYYEDDLNGHLWLLSELWWLGLYAAGVCLALAGLVRLFRSPSKRLSLMAVVLVGGAWVLMHVQGETLQSLHLRNKIACYRAIVRRLETARPAAGWQRSGGQECIVDAGQPLRVAFPQPGGLLDNYRAVVYDPTGLVMQANLAGNSGNPARVPEKVRALFGGDLVWAEPLGGPWYRCGFT